ncbi:hypothetical protein H6F67_15580 [Microcoleus sp. FACHB-1515]|uniref:calcium-binding protein n=1 Tax=Cyanophyceae TaxID=3028117 RepID=UPI0016876CD0|nr:calcium-binding protein [Microcoleus sp. FACHB-1515]MBD2091276.1 hypothetical protein [Microcoleus sp. FACHB-1515]
MVRVVGSIASDRLFGSFGNDELFGLGGNDVLVGSAGSDLMDGATGFDAVDYSGLGRAVTILPGGAIAKSGLGTDRISSVERIVGAIGQANAIDGTGRGTARFDINLAANRLTVNGLPGIGTLSFAVENFVNVRGTANRDIISGNFLNNFIDGDSGDDGLFGDAGNDTLIGRGGNDSINGGNGFDLLTGDSGNDTLIGAANSDTLIGGDGIDVLLGTNNVNRGFNEIDTLTGGAGSDGFVLGDRSGAYYKAQGAGNYAQINDFGAIDLIVLGTGEAYQVRRDANGFDLFAVTNGLSELIADVRTTSFISLPTGTFRLASGQTFGNFVGA